jgi:uncharacterized tellurite resistance protein B-like protein
MPSITALVPASLQLAAEEADLLLELVYLVAAADGRLLDEELVSFTELTARLRGKESVDAEEMDGLIEKIAHAVEPAEIEARLKEVAGALRKELHELAYKLALGMAFVDWDPSNEEDRLHALLANTLGIDAERRAALSREVTMGG